jgi:hemolysin III
VFAVSLAAVYIVSGIYHVFARTLRAQNLWQRFDHSAIYLLIAGTMTPFVLLAASGWVRWVVLAVAWTGAAIGVVLALMWRARRVGNALYLAIGWLAVAAFPSALMSSPPAVVVLFAVGGLTYTVGSVLFALSRPVLRPAVFGYHEVWHVATVCAGAAHFVAVAALSGALPVSTAV